MLYTSNSHDIVNQLHFNKTMIEKVAFIIIIIIKNTSKIRERKAKLVLRAFQGRTAAPIVTCWQAFFQFSRAMKPRKHAA